MALQRLRRFRAGKKLAVRLEREQHPQSIGHDEQHRQTDAQLPVNSVPAVKSPWRPRWNHQRGRGQEEQAGLHAGCDSLYSCTWCLSPPSRNDAPNMNRVLVTIAPAIDAFTSMYSPARKAVRP